VPADDDLDQRAQRVFEALHLVDWSYLYSDDRDTGDRWLLEPIFARGRGHAFFAPGKMGKSELLLACVVLLVIGRTFDGRKVEPVDVLYLDYEMTEDDLLDRLDALGLGPDDLQHLHYAHLPSLPPLDTKAGGTQLVAAALGLGVQFVVVDTIGRAVDGAEDSNDTIQDFYRHTGQLLKAHGIGCARAAHAGKTAGKGQRGGSAANDDVDVIVEVKRTDHGTRLTAKGQRIGWYPSITDLTRTERDDGRISWSLTNGAAWPAGTKQCADDLDRLGVPLDASKREAANALRDADLGRRNDIVLAALKYRRSGPGDHQRPNDGTTDRDQAA
jgi:hypothetical protein